MNEISLYLCHKKSDANDATPEDIKNTKEELFISIRQNKLQLIEKLKKP